MQLTTLIDAWPANREGPVPALGPGRSVRGERRGCASTAGAMTIHTTRRLKLAVLAGCSFVTVASGGVLLASRLRDHADFVAGVATFIGALLFGLAWLWWPRPRIKLLRRRASRNR